MLLLCFYVFHHNHPAFSHPKRAREGWQLTLCRARVEIFLKMFFGEKCTTPIPSHPTHLSRFILKKNIKSPLKYNSPLFHITSNIDKFTYTQQPIQQHTYTGAENRWEILIIIPYITVLFFVCHVSNTTLLSKKRRTGIMREEKAHHQFKAITLVFLTHTHTTTNNNITSSSVENWEKITRRADAGVVGWGEFENESFLLLVEGESWFSSTKVGWKKNLWSAPFTASHPLPCCFTLLLSRLFAKRKKNHYQLLYFFLTRNEAPNGGVTFDIFNRKERGMNSACVVMMDEKLEKNVFLFRSQINKLCSYFGLLWFSLILILHWRWWQLKTYAKVWSIVNKLMKIHWMYGGT